VHAIYATQFCCTAKSTSSCDSDLIWRIICFADIRFCQPFHRPATLTQKIATPRLAALRKALKKAGLDGCFVPRTDDFLGEYVPACGERLKWLTGFSGSSGTAVIGRTSAALIVDGRYTIQAAKETRGLTILQPDADALTGFLRASFAKGAVIGFDPWVTSVSEARRLDKLATRCGFTLQASRNNMVDAIWTDPPAPPANPVTMHATTLAGETVQRKLATIAKSLAATSCDATILTDAHSVAWLLNMRGSDIAHTPIALLRAIVHKNQTATLFVAATRCSADLLKAFGKQVKLSPPSDFAAELQRLGTRKMRVMLDPALCPEAIRVTLTKAKAQVTEATDPCALPRARKNPVEQRGARAAHLRDGAALANFLCWIDARAASGHISEKAAEDRLATFRAATGKLVDLSFGSISASGPNAALPHYHVVGNTGRMLKRGEIYLIDSGGQYRDGTTDVTRTVIIGEPTSAMKMHYTLVLKGMIAVSVARFPVGTTGVQIDVMARQALWQCGFDFDHGTGHGVGSFLSVHEGPARISKAGHVALEPGMILSNEPGYYLKGKYGIRIENLLLVQPPRKTGGGDRPMLSFETLTFAPIDKRLIDELLLTRSELQWLDQYHAEVLRKLGSRVNTETVSWLEAVCSPFKHRAS
jgi:Xaa-Pro aminopeptidase